MKARVAAVITGFTGFALGAAAVQGLHAQTKPPGFAFIEVVEVLQPDSFRNEFLPAAAKALQGEGGKYLVRTSAAKHIEGVPPSPTAILQFESVERAEAAVRSQAYRDARAGDKYAKFRIWVAEGVAQ